MINDSYLNPDVVLCVLTGCCCDRDTHTKSQKGEP